MLTWDRNLHSMQCITDIRGCQFGMCSFNFLQQPETTMGRPGVLSDSESADRDLHIVLSRTGWRCMSLKQEKIACSLRLHTEDLCLLQRVVHMVSVSIHPLAVEVEILSSDGYRGPRETQCKCCLCAP